MVSEIEWFNLILMRHLEQLTDLSYCIALYRFIDNDIIIHQIQYSQ